MKRASNSGLYHFSKKTGNQVRLWERLRTGIRRRLAYRYLKSRAEQGSDLEARYWLARLKINQGQEEQGWQVLNELWFQGCRVKGYTSFLWKQARAGLEDTATGSLQYLDHRVSWDLALYFWHAEAGDEVPGFLAGLLEQGWLGSMEFRLLCDQVQDTRLLVKLAEVLTKHSAHNALLHILYRRLWTLLQRGGSWVSPGEIRVLLAGLDYLPPGVWQFCFDCWYDRKGNGEQQWVEGMGNDGLGDLLIDYFLLRRERGFFPLQALRELASAKLQKREQSLRAARLFNYLRLREFRWEEWKVALAQCILPVDLPPDPAWLNKAQEWTEMSLEDLLALLGQLFRAGYKQRELVVSLGIYLLNSPKQEQLEAMGGLAQELWKFRNYLSDGELVRLGTILARQMIQSGKYAQALECIEECLVFTSLEEELYLWGLPAALVQGKLQEAAVLTEKAEGCLSREGVEQIRRKAVESACFPDIHHPALLRAQLSELAGENPAVSGTVLARHLLKSRQLRGEELYWLRKIVGKGYRHWGPGAGKGMAVKEPLAMVLVRQEGLTGWEASGSREYGWDPVYSLQLLLHKLRSEDWERLLRNREVVGLAGKLWRYGIARREELVLDFLVKVQSELAEGERAEILAALGEYCLAQGRVDGDAGAVYRQVYRLRGDNLPNLYYLSKSLLSAELPLPPGPGYGANVLIWGSVISGTRKLPVPVRPGIGPAVTVRRVFNERLTYKVQYFGGGEIEGEFSGAAWPGKDGLGQNLLAENVEIFVQVFRHFPNYLDNLVNLALLSPYIDLEAELKLQVLERCLKLRELEEEALGVIRRELAKYSLKQGDYARARELLQPCDAGGLPSQALAVLWTVGCQVALGLAAGEEALKALTGTESMHQTLLKQIRRTGDGLV